MRCAHYKPQDLWDATRLVGDGPRCWLMDAGVTKCGETLQAVVGPRGMPASIPKDLQPKVKARLKEAARADGSVSHRTRQAIRSQEVDKATYLKLLESHWTPGVALKAVGVHRSMLYIWRETDAAFLVAEQQVKDGIADALEAEAVKRAYKGVRKPVFQGGLLAGHVTEYSDQLLMFLLKAMRPDRFRERSEVQVTPIVKVVAGFDPAQVL